MYVCVSIGSCKVVILLKVLTYSKVLLKRDKGNKFLANAPEKNPTEFSTEMLS